MPRSSHPFGDEHQPSCTSSVLDSNTYVPQRSTLRHFHSAVLSQSETPSFKQAKLKQFSADINDIHLGDTFRNQALLASFLLKFVACMHKYCT
jgi:hypothetical protein